MVCIYCEGADKKSVPSVMDRMEEQRKEGENQDVTGNREGTEGDLTVEEKAGKSEICLAEGEWEEQKVSVWEEDKSKEGVV